MRAQGQTAHIAAMFLSAWALGMSAHKPEWFGWYAFVVFALNTIGLLTYTGEWDTITEEATP